MIMMMSGCWKRRRRRRRWMHLLTLASELYGSLFWQCLRGRAKNFAHYIVDVVVALQHYLT